MPSRPANPEAVIIRTGLILTGILATTALLPVPAQAEPTAIPARVELRLTRHADVDGDGRLDTVRIYNAGKKGDNTLWKVTVTTARGRTGSVTLPILSYQGTDHLWRGWALLDGGRGAELIIEPQTDDFSTYIVLTWHGGALHREFSPLGPEDAKRDRTWEAATETNPSGFRFFTSKGKRYVNTWRATCPDQPDKPGTCTVKTVRSVWRGGDWHKVATLPTAKISNMQIYQRSPLGALVIHS